MNESVEMIGNELRNVVAFWRARSDDGARFPVPSLLTWTFDQGPIVEGQVLGLFTWPDATQTPFIAPRGCHGTVIDISDRFETELFHREPAQVLLRIHG